MTLIRLVRFLVLLVVIVTFMFGCVRPEAGDRRDGTHGIPITSREEITPKLNGKESGSTVVGPYDHLIFLSEEEARKRIGEPTEVDTTGTSSLWKYPDLGLTLRFYDRVLITVYQTRGRVTDDIVIGDDDGQARALAEDVRPGDNGTLIFTLPHDEVVVTVVSANGTVVRARLEVPSHP